MTLVVLVAAQACSATDGTGSKPPAPSNTTLYADGVGPYRLGDPATLVIDGVSSLIGGFDGDSLDGDGTLEHAQCDEDLFRQVSWGNLVLFFEIDGGESFIAWTYGYDPILGNSDNERGLNLVTEEGIGLTSSRSELESAYGARVDITDDTAIDVASFTIDASDTVHIVGGLAEAMNPDALVLSLESAPGCAQPLP